MSAIAVTKKASASRAAPTKRKGGSPEDARQEVLSMLNNNAFPRRVYLSPAEWAEIEPNPRQRDTARHAAKADHLRNPHPIHSIVNMAVLPDGRRFKLDGHTRGFLWEKGDVPAPAVLIVETWECENIDQVKQLYGYFDNSDAVETSTDRMFGAYREHGFEFKSPLLSSRKIATGARFAYQFLFGSRPAVDATEYDLLRYWKPELYLLDGCMPNWKVFPTPITAASLLTFRRYGNDAFDFWDRYAKDKGNKINGEKDAVQALHDRINSLRGHRKLTNTGNIQSVIAVALSAYNADRKGYAYSGGIKPLGKEALSDFAASAKSTIRTWG